MIFPQICEITAANYLRMGKNAVKLSKHFLNIQKFEQTVSVHLHLFSCLLYHMMHTYPKYELKSQRQYFSSHSMKFDKKKKKS